MADKNDAWDRSSQQQAAVQVYTPYKLNTPEGAYFPRTPIFDQVCFVDINTLAAVAPGTEIFPAIPGTSYIIGQPSLIIDNMAAYLATGAAIGIYGTVFDPSGSNYQNTGIIGLGAGWAPPPGPIKTAPGFNVSAGLFSTSPGPGVAYLVVPVVRVVSI